MTAYEQTAVASFDDADHAQCQLATLLDTIAGKLLGISTDNAVRSVPDIHAASNLLDVAAIIMGRLERLRRTRPGGAMPSRLVARPDAREKIVA